MILIKTYLITFVSLLRIYLLTLKKRKNIIFYFPVKIYQKNLISLANSLSKKNGVFMIYNMSSTYRKLWLVKEEMEFAYVSSQYSETISEFICRILFV